MSYPTDEELLNAVREPPPYTIADKERTMREERAEQLRFANPSHPSHDSLRHLCQDANARAHRKGFYDPPQSVGERLNLIHDEVSEASEANRDGDMLTRFVEDKYGHLKPVGFPSEIADIVIRCADLCGEMGIDLAEEIRLKSRYNETRPHKHGRKF